MKSKTYLWIIVLLVPACPSDSQCITANTGSAVLVQSCAAEPAWK